AADAHAEGENRVLQQGQGFFQGRIVCALQQMHGLLDFRAHELNVARETAVCGPGRPSAVLYRCSSRITVRIRASLERCRLWRRTPIGFSRWPSRARQRLKPDL